MYYVETLKTKKLVAEWSVKCFLKFSFACATLGPFGSVDWYAALVAGMFLFQAVEAVVVIYRFQEFYGRIPAQARTHLHSCVLTALGVLLYSLTVVWLFLKAGFQLHQ